MRGVRPPLGWDGAATEAGTALEWVLYTKAGCHICEDVRARLWDVATATGCTVREIDIVGDAVLFARYRLRVPVVEWAGEELVAGPWRSGVEARLLHRARQRPQRRGAIPP